MNWFEHASTADLMMMLAGVVLINLICAGFYYLGKKINEFFRGLGFRDSDDG